MNMMAPPQKPTRSLWQRLRASEGLRAWHADKRRTEGPSLGGYSPAAPITHKTCQYIAGEPALGAQQRFCGAVVVAGTSWCAKHHAWVLIPPFMSMPKEPSVSDQRLLSIVERIVRLEEEKRGLSRDIRDIMQEAKSAGYDAKAVRVIARRRMEDADQRKKREEVEQSVELMMAALGDLATSPLGQAAIARG